MDKCLSIVEMDLVTSDDDEEESLNNEHAQRVSDDFVLEAVKKGIKIHTISTANALVLAIPHSSSVTLHGYVKISVLFGCVSILGHLIISEEKDTEVLSIEGRLLKISTFKSKPKHIVLTLRNKLSQIFPRERILPQDDFFPIDNTPAAVVIIQRGCRIHLPPSIKLLDPVELPKTKKIYKLKVPHKNDYLCSFQDQGTFTVSSESECLAQAINEIIRKSDETECGSRIIVYGPQHSGNSSLLHYLINNALNGLPYVYYLNIDPDQTEFSPLGTVSLCRITEPLLGLPFSCRHIPLKMSFIGINSKDSPQMYLESIFALIDFYKRIHCKTALFVDIKSNTKGIDDMLLQKIKEYLEPNIQIHKVPSHDLTEMEKVQVLNNCVVYRIPEQVELEIPTLIANEKNFRNSKVYETVYLDAFRPVWIRFDNIAVHLMGRTVSPRTLTEEVLHNVFALCCVKENLILQNPHQKTFPGTLRDGTLHDCLGFGFVNAVEDEHIYIRTPISLEELRLVNALIKVDILAPNAVSLNQAKPKKRNCGYPPAYFFRHKLEYW